MMKYPEHLARLVRKELRRRDSIPLSKLKVLKQMFETLYFTSMKTEELQHLRLSVDFIPLGPLEAPFGELYGEIDKDPWTRNRRVV
jgi:hypothetical protein